ncbi:DNA repair exonuclease [Halobacteroides halobius DSM 5150]|uniref:DNA repair exonuclease n=1 Tax=Halobacteroides halobius (strain ATCC 35273 / DSM 5150 / MD-1) TaxID=748449 RepID=L0K8C8_HALHC|nr:metallophosphoesterase [Halobacteroides halobius]AGB41542.1 DNA repair exonuclease [Halobacteroides halobius DSM 5150]
MKVLVMSDTHIRGTTPSRRTDNFKKTLINKLQEVKEIAQEEKIDFILHAGDVFDRPNPAPSVVNDFLKVLSSYPIPIYVVAGNHDLYGHNPDTLSRTMLGVLINSGVLNLIEEPITLTKDKLKLQLSGKHFDYNVDTDGSAYMINKEQEVDYALHMIHGMLLDRPFFDQGYTLIEDVTTEADIIISGHYHLGFGEQEFNGTKFVNPGSLVRMSADIKEINRQPQVAIIELDSEIMVKFRKLTSAKPGGDVLDRSALEAAKFREKKLADFTQTIKAAGEFKYFSVEQILEQVASNEQIDDNVKKEALNRISQAQEKLGGE